MSVYMYFRLSLIPHSALLVPFWGEKSVMSNVMIVTPTVTI